MSEPSKKWSREKQRRANMSPDQRENYLRNNREYQAAADYIERWRKT